MYKEDKSKSKKPNEFQIELVVYLDEEDQIKQVFDLNLGINVVGSSPKDSTIIINKPEVEKRHLQIEIELDKTTNILSPQIQSLKSESGTQKKLKDGNFTSILPGKWSSMGDLSREFIFYIAKKYKCVVRKVAKNEKLNRSIDASSNQNSNPIPPVSKINFLKSLDNLDAGENSWNANQQETKSDIVTTNLKGNNNDALSDLSASKPKVFGKNFKSKVSPTASATPVKTLHTSFKVPTVTATNENTKETTLKQSNDKNKKPTDVAKPNKSAAATSNNEKKGEKTNLKVDVEQQPVVSLQIPKSPTTKGNTSNKGSAQKSAEKGKDLPQNNDEVKAEQKGKKKRGPNKKKGSSDELELSLDFSIEMSEDGNNDDKKNKNQKDSKMVDESDITKVLSTDDEDEDEKTGKKNTKMIDEVEDKKKNGKKQLPSTKTSAKEKNSISKTDTNKDSEKADKGKKQAGKVKDESKTNNKRKGKKELEEETNLMEIEEEDHQTDKKQSNAKNTSMKNENDVQVTPEVVVIEESAQKKGGLKPNLAKNAFGNKKRKTSENVTDSEKKVEDKAMKNEMSASKKEDKKEDNKKDSIKKDKNKMEDESKPQEAQVQEVTGDKKLKGKQADKKEQVTKTSVQSEKEKKETSKLTVQSKDTKKSTKEAPAKSAKATKAETKKQEKKKEKKKAQDKRNSVVKNNMVDENEEDEEELSHVINSDGEEEYVLKGGAASKSANKKSPSKKFNVLFSNCGLDETDVQNRLSKLGVRIMKTLQQPFNVLIMDEFTRRAKTLVALNKGAKIISSQWVLDCICSERLIEEIDKYEIKVDKAFSKKHKFEFQEVKLRNENQSEPIFSGLQFILPVDEVYQNIARDDLEHIIMTAGGNVISEDDCDDIEDKDSVKIIFDNDKNDNSHTSPGKNNQQKAKLSDSKKKVLDENRQKLQYAYKKNNYDCVMIEAIFQSCLHQKLVNWSDFQV